jgi:DNA-binding HxlR family transcriptional regulator
MVGIQGVNSEDAAIHLKCLSVHPAGWPFRGGGFDLATYGDPPWKGRAYLQVLDGKWTLAILWQLKEGPLRYGDQRRAIPATSDKVPTQHLRDLERDGIVEREVRDANPPQVSYCFSVYGRTLIPLIQGFCAWGEQHLRRQSHSDVL